jgi:signal transduction histidine kinase
MKLGARGGLPLKRGVSAVTILVVIVMMLVPALAWMQYQWLGQLSSAERDRMQRTLRTAASQFATEFDSTLSRTLVGLQVDGTTIRDGNWTAYAQRYSQWATSVSEPRLVRDVWLVDTLPGTPLPAMNSATPVAPDRLRIRKWSPQTLTFDDAEWPADLDRMRVGLAGRFIGFQLQNARLRGDNGERHETSISLSIGDDTTLISPVTLFELSENHTLPPKISILGFTIVRLNPVVMRDSIIASLAARHFHGDDTEADYRVAVVDRKNPAKVVWESEPGVAATIAASPDVTQAFMGPRPDQMFVFARNLRDLVPGVGNREPGVENHDSNRLAQDPGSAPGSSVIVSMIEKETRAAAGARGGQRIVTRAADIGDIDGRWMLMAKHRAGSLEAAVAAVRMRNLLISSSVLLLLTLAIGLIVVSARRAQELARQQIEFVAAVSHELRTPVSVIGTAAGNLADGVVGDPQRVRKYGETIQGEARRLGETVERVLQLAGIAAGRAAAARTPVNPSDLIQQSLAACGLEIDKAGVNVEVAIADDLPNVVGDVTALTSALQNLISNAVKYGGNARWLRVSARRDAGAGGRDQVQFIVEDHGLGIEAEDRKHIFEPFYRGRDAVSQQIQGSGLGLNLVLRIAEAHGGKVAVVSEPGKGSTFTLALPAVSDSPASEALNLVRETSPSR